MIQAQSLFDKTMSKNIERLQNATSAEEFMGLSKMFSEASSQEPKNWLPGYYEALSYVKAGEFLLIKGKTDELETIGEQIIKRVDNSMALAKGDKVAESELYVLKGLGHFYKLMENPEKNFKPEADLIWTSLKEAKARYEENPRIELVYAMAIYHFPDNIGGTKEKGAILLKESVRNLNSFKPIKPLYPNWGKGEAELLLNTK